LPFNIQFTDSIIINKAYAGQDEFQIDGGYMFLDELNGKTGIIRIYSGDYIVDNNGDIEIGGC
jgi:hypothetical protein